MRPGAYSFDLNTPGAAYEFQYNINSDETNLDVLDKLARLVNSSSLELPPKYCPMETVRVR